MHITPDESGHTPLSELEIAPIFGISPDVLAGDLGIIELLEEPGVSKDGGNFIPDH